MTRSLAERIADIKEWEPSVEQIAAENIARCQAIEECERDVKRLQSRLRRLKAEHKAASLSTQLRTSAEEVWPTLSRKEKFKKHNLLAALQSPILPSELEERQWATQVPERLKDDRDLFLARLERVSFTEFYPPHILEIPTALRGDKKVMTNVLAKYPEVLQQNGVVSQDLLQDPDFFMVLLDPNSTWRVRTLTAADLMQFSPEIRSSHSLMLKALDKLPIEPTYVAKELRNDKNFALEAAKCYAFYDCGRFFRHVSPRLRADLDVAMVYCRKNGDNLKHVSYPLRRHAGLIKTACAQDPSAILHALKSKGRHNLLSNRRFVLSIASEKCYRVNDELRDKLWKWISADLKKDRLVAAALATERSTDRELFDRYEHDREFWELLLQREAKFWNHLPDDLCNDIDLALIAARSDLRGDLSLGLLTLLTAFFGPDRIWGDRQVITNLVRTVSPEVWDPIMLSVPRELLADKAFVLELCEMDGRVYQYVSPELMEDRDVIECALNDAPEEVLAMMPHPIQHLHPGLIAHTIRDADEDVDDLIDDICEDLWSNRDVTLAWLSRGGNYLDWLFPEEFEDDEEIFLAVAEHSPEDFMMVSDDLRSNKEFMMKVVAIDGTLITEVDESLKDDFDLMLIAFNDQADLPSSFLSVTDYQADGFRRLTRFAVKVRKRLRAYRSFLVVLGGISSTRAAESCPLSVLNQGQETALAYKSLLRDYLGTPRGEELQQLKNVSANLARWGF